MTKLRTAFVTGAGRGIGLAIAKGLIARNHRVYAGVRNVEDQGQMLHEAGAIPVPLDVTSKASIQSAVEAVGGVDILVNNAGVLRDEALFASSEAISEALKVMVEGPHALIRAVKPHMVANGYGRIVNLSSEWGSFGAGLEGPAAYAIAKAALNALTAIAPRDLPDTVKVNAVCPGWVRTRMGGADAPRSVEEGAQTALWLATLPEDGPTGGFFRDYQPFAW